MSLNQKYYIENFSALSIHRNMADLSISQAELALNLMRYSSNADQSAFLSPVSIAVALAMTYAGADGKTKAEMSKALFGGSHKLFFRNPKDFFRRHRRKCPPTVRDTVERNGQGS